jgi:hypothetical protein
LLLESKYLMSVELISLIISIVALIVSVVTFWLTRLRRGVIKMTKPTVIFFGPDRSVESKVFIRTLLYSTSDRGQYIENMYLRLNRKGWSQDFNVWVYGEPTSLARGSGLFVSKHGLATNHHFLLPKDGSSFKVKSGDYKLEVYAELVGRKPRRVYTQNLVVTQAQEKELLEKDAGIYFDWAPNTQAYQSHIDRRP